MINIRKYNESWQNDRFTLKDLQIIENIFLDWEDRKCVFYKAVIGHRGEGPLTATKLTAQEKILRFPDQVDRIICQISLLNSSGPTRPQNFPGVHYDVDWDIFDFEFPFNHKSKFGFLIQSMEDFDQLFEAMPFETSDQVTCRRVLSTLDHHFMIKKQMVDLANQFKGLRYYGYNFLPVLTEPNLKEKWTNTISEFDPNKSEWPGCFLLDVSFRLEGPAGTWPPFRRDQNVICKCSCSVEMIIKRI